MLLSLSIPVGAQVATPGDSTSIATAGSTQFTPLLDTVLSPPHWFTGTDGQVHLVYELVLTNPLLAPITVSAVEVLDANSGGTLMRLSGHSLTAAMSLATSPETPAVLLAPATVGIVWLDVVLASAGDIPTAVAHRLTIDPPPDVPVPEAWLSYTGASVEVDRRPPVVLGAPLTGAGWAALGSCCDGPHRRALLPIGGRWYLPQRFAIDFNQLDAQNRPGIGNPTLPTSFPTFGQPVLAVADASVVEAVDRYPDLLVGEPREDLTPENAGGNRIVLDLGEGRFAVYAHLQSGSLAVQPGDQVTRGQHIANVGSSGTPGGPHLHFQVTDRPSVVVGGGLPYVFDVFELTGQTPPLTEVLPYYDTLEPIPITRERTGMHHDELPLGRDVVTFPTAQPDLPVPDTGDFSGLVDIDGRSLYLECRGQGSPTVILVTGYRDRGDPWSTDLLQPDSARTMVQPGVAAFTRVCSYDRPGTVLDADHVSRSDPVAQPQTAADAAADLHAVLGAAAIPGPYVLVGHSYGGLVVRLYASTYPDEVAGLVLVDALPALETWLTPEQWAAYQHVLNQRAAVIADYRDLETIDVDASAAQMREAAVRQPLRSLPLVVLTRVRPLDLPPDLPPGFSADALERAWAAGQAELATLVPGARHVVATESGHAIQLDQPEVVIEAIRQVVTAVRDPASWATPAVAPGS